MKETLIRSFDYKKDDFEGTDFKRNSYKSCVSSGYIQGLKSNSPSITATILQGLGLITKYGTTVALITRLSYQKKVGSYEPTLYHYSTIIYRLTGIDQ